MGFNFWMVGTESQPIIVSSLNIFFHEAGHWIFSFFGRFIMVLGGTLGELIVPSLFVAYFSFHRKIPGQIFSWWWLTTALYSVSTYVADARARELYIIGGQEGHDWAYLLGTTGLLEYDIFISRILIVAVLCITLYMGILVYRYYGLYQGKILS
jgi:hypothetical protein